VRREAAQVSLLDVAPTVLSWAGLDVPTGFGGASLLAPPGAREAYGETDHTDDGSRKLFLRSGARGGKAIFSLTSDGSRVLREEWYDLANGGETHPQAPRADTAAAFRQRALDRWRERNARGPGAPVELTPEQKERLRALGYVGP
jgi:arylsulfatase A-like enzyme